MNGLYHDTGPCRSCGKASRPDRIDPCIGKLPGVSHACCGHGDESKAYAVLGGQPNDPCQIIPNRAILRGRQALTFFALIDAGELLVVDGKVKHDRRFAERRPV